DVARYPTWRPDVQQVDVLPDSDGVFRFRETGRHGVVAYRVERNEPPTRWVTRIDDPSLPYGGTWTFGLAPRGSGTSLTITEDGEIYNPIFRVLSRTVFSTAATIEAYQAALRRHLESPVRP
ncbi:MAG TPA: SRPBCC family protein, partial [Gemmatimonadaceae bacterium]|nr:SRPBCC family protein [Gemmatimonadaceae bacterium]